MKKRLIRMGTGAMPLFIFFLALMLLSGCTALKSKNTTSQAATPQASAKAENAPTYYDFGDVLIPSEMKIDKNDSFVFRTPGMTVGMLSVRGRVERSSLSNFFENKMPVDGWRMISSIEGRQTMMLFQKNNRWCVINISEGGLSTSAEIWVSTGMDGGMGLRK